MSDREKQLTDMLTKANGLIRSFSAVCDREGRATNWQGLKNEVRTVLREQHDYMHPNLGPRAG